MEKSLLDVEFTFCRRLCLDSFLFQIKRERERRRRKKKRGGGAEGKWSRHIRLEIDLDISNL